MLCKPKLSPRRRRIRRILTVTAAVVLILCVFLEFAVKSQLTDVICAEEATLAQRAVNAAVTDHLASDPDIGERLTSIHYADSGAVTSVTDDPAAVNRFKAAISESAQERIESAARREGLAIPLGSFTGCVFLTNTGPDVRMDIGSRATVTCRLKSTFTSAGVNQTVHHIFLIVDVEIVVFNPFRIRQPIHTTADFEIAQTVIVGDVPSYVPSALIQ